jgi:hypothetical protein
LLWGRGGHLEIPLAKQQKQKNSETQRSSTHFSPDSESLFFILQKFCHGIWKLKPRAFWCVKMPVRKYHRYGPGMGKPAMNKVATCNLLYINFHCKAIVIHSCHVAWCLILTISVRSPWILVGQIVTTQWLSNMVYI